MVKSMGGVGPPAPSPGLASYLEGLYHRYNRRSFVAPDPLQFLYDYPSPEAQEVVGLVASTLAYGRVSQILKSVSTALGRMGDPMEFLRLADGAILKEFVGFKHRFTTGEQLGRLLLGVKRLREEYGGLGPCFRHMLRPEDPDYAPVLDRFVERLSEAAEDPLDFLLPRPARGSACKRLFLFLRWMVRCDEVDPGCWHHLLSPAGLLIPMDTHMTAIGRGLGAIAARGATLATARRLTRFFAQIDPNDPVKYDFALTRFGIREELSIDRLQLSHHRCQ